MSQIAIVRTVADLRAQVASWKRAGERVALVPTMGALHEGHLSLIALAKTKADRVVASVFVNPTQFGPNEDFDAYPRGEARDAELLAGAGCDLLFAPTVGEMYPQGFATSVNVTGVSEPLDGAARPGHFAGVATVVSKLLLQCGPDDLDRNVQVADHALYDLQLLEVLLAKDRDVGAALQQQLGDHGGDAGEVSRTSGAVQRVRDAGDVDGGGEALGVHLAHRGRVEQVAAGRGQ